MKHLILIISFVICSLTGLANNYIVNSKHGLNVRSQPSVNSNVVATLSYQTEIEVNAFEGDWAKILWNEGEGYVNKNYIVPSKANVEQGKSTSWSFWGWLFSFDGSFWACVKWLFILVFGLTAGFFAFEFIGRILAAGLGVWILTLMVCVILWMFRIIESETIWRAAKWGFNIGLVCGVIYVILDFRNVVSEIFSSGSSSSCSSGSSCGGGCGSSSYNDTWNDNHGSVFTDSSGERYVVDGNGKRHWLWSDYESSAHDDGGEEWSIHGDSAEKVKR